MFSLAQNKLLEVAEIGEQEIRLAVDQAVALGITGADGHGDGVDGASRLDISRGIANHDDLGSVEPTSEMVVGSSPREPRQIGAIMGFIAEGADGEPVGVEASHFQLDRGRFGGVAGDQSDEGVAAPAQVMQQFQGMGKGLGSVGGANRAHVPGHDGLVGVYFAADIGLAVAVGRQQISQDTPIGLAAEDMAVQVAGPAEAFQHGAAFGFAPDAAADQQGAVYIEEDDVFHAPAPKPPPP